MRHLQAFMTLAEELHFGRAARRLNMTQPPLSQIIRQLEQLVGTPLLSRTTRSVSLTPAGQAFLAKIRPVPEVVDLAAQAARRAAEQGPSCLSIGFTASTAYDFLPEMIRVFRTAHPGIELDLREMTSIPLLAGLRSGSLDVALVRPLLEGPDLSSCVIQREELMLVLPSDHPLAARHLIGIPDLAGEPLVAFSEEASPYLSQLIQTVLRSGGVQPQIVQRAVMPTLLSFVVAGIGVALVPASARRHAIQGVAFRNLHALAGDQRVELLAAWRADDQSPLVASWRRLVQTMRHPEIAFS
ncbi:LysR family transcriptional regulator [Roseomonas populi]|uniref:LysR family transcriptional regulator n=1 Tax=Roseomonas populi TaxID=3121582 RepID=A0ABT1XA74_9PROT|nr:LysR family transcriptional regulator [Roseomonas pecuniae]MCR0985011.1 LysR family transcriptional regulator [Roseomonas pecuniae]